MDTAVPFPTAVVADAEVNLSMTTNATVDMMTVATSALWERIFDEVQLVVTVAGILANSLTLITLMKNGDEFSDIICMLLKYQSLVDAVNCIIVALIFKLPGFWEVGNDVIDTLVCHLWHTQHLYWVGVFLSVWNLVTLAIERYICVCHPLKYNRLTKGTVRKVIFFFFMLGVVYLMPGVFQANRHSGHCVNELFWQSPAAKSFFFAFALSAFFTFYVIPTILFFFTYGCVINNFRTRAKSNLGASGTANVIEKASAELTKTAVVVTVIFILAYSYIFWLFMLAYAGVTEYKMKSTMQKIGTFLSVVNLVANPIVYASLMPAYRRSVVKTLCCALPKGKSDSN